ncbi:hypothetical protein DPEC_G00377880 [Dallia pectoralis]|nr:hypothetical protein DPEC_G00377880 [Dallia pectoralis]
MKHGDTGLPALLEKHGEVFNGELGSMKNITVKLNIKPDSKPKLMKARPVPYAIRPRVEADLDALVTNKALEDRMFLVMVDAHSRARSSHHEVYYGRKTIEKLGECSVGSDHRFNLNTPHATTKASPASLLMKRVDLLRPPTTKEIVQRQQERQVVERRGIQGEDREFNPGETVLARNYLNGPKWFPPRSLLSPVGVLYSSDYLRMQSEKACRSVIIE